jgi:3-deoxy-D-manno-octulosonate 8-phosphate phosphatase KdsC-like HAD superfamily phosphatase
MFVGNDINDIPALKIVGMPVGVKDSYPEIDKYIKFKTKNNGGEGAVREISDLVYNNFKIN